MVPRAPGVGLRLRASTGPQELGKRGQGTKKTLLAGGRFLVDVLHKVGTLFVILFHDGL